MIAFDEDALRCDLAETYCIYDYESLPPSVVATFSVGLRENSRIKLKISGQKFPLETILLSMAVDRLALLWWSKTKDAEHDRGRPESILQKLLGENTQDRDYEVFDTPEAFEAAKKEMKKRREEKNGY